MTIAEMFGQSAILALLGMGIVFGFIVILIGFMGLVAKFVKLAGLDKEEQLAPVSASASRPANADAAITAAISAAVNEYRKNNQE